MTPTIAPVVVAMVAACGVPVGPRLPEGCGYAPIPDATVRERLVDAVSFPVQAGWPAVVFWTGTAAIVLGWLVARVFRQRGWAR